MTKMTEEQRAQRFVMRREEVLIIPVSDKEAARLAAEKAAAKTR